MPGYKLDENMILSLLKNKYNLNVLSLEKMTIGAGGNTYIIYTNNKKYVIKLTEEDSMNHPLVEPLVCEILNNNGINTLSFIKNIDNEYSTRIDDYIANVYVYIDGSMASHNSLNKNVVNECANLLGKINIALKDLKLDYGLSSDFFNFMKPDKALKSYIKSLEKAKKINNLEIINYIETRIELLKYIENWCFDTKKLTYCNSHGDYTNNQIIINDDINIIDFTVCCKQPVIWELTRFFFHADESANNGKLDKVRFYEYLSYYQKNIVLNEYDLDNVFKLYFYQILVCDYYSLYFSCDDVIMKNDYLIQANFASKILVANIDLIKK